MAMAQTQTEQPSSPSMTVLTIQCACQNSVNSERSAEVSGSTDCATSVGFIGTSFPLSGVNHFKRTILSENRYPLFGIVRQPGAGAMPKQKERRAHALSRKRLVARKPNVPPPAA